MTNERLKMLLGGMETEQFLAEYWQKKPLVVRDAFPGAEDFCDPDELAGVALEEEVESRIICGSDAKRADDWSVLLGPFTEQTFAELPEENWTLLVQTANFYFPSLVTLLELFRFIPRWRLDDIMVSYATPGGSVGPHYDNYDVFLIQGQGQRHWRVGQSCDASSPLLGHADVRLLKTFEQTDEWLLGPGDMLYLPPRIAHYGVAVDHCTTYSVGFQSPARGQLVEAFCDYVMQNSGLDDRYQDPDLQRTNHCGLLSKEAVQRVQQMLFEQLNDETAVTEWLAAAVSSPKHDGYVPDLQLSPGGAQLLARLASEGEIRRDEASRFLYTGSAESPQQFYLNGESQPWPEEHAELLVMMCDYDRLSVAQLQPLLNDELSLQWFCELYQQGCFYFEDSFVAE